MKELIEVNKAVCAVTGALEPRLEIQVGRSVRGAVASDGLEALPEGLRGAIMALKEQIGFCIPDDFSFCFFLGGSEPDLLIEYEDGPQTAAFGGGPQLDPGKSIFDQLRAYDWDADRAARLSQTGVFEKMLAEAEKRPAQIPDIKKLQKRFREEMREFVKKRRAQPGVFVLAVQPPMDEEAEEEWVDEQCKDLDDLPGVFEDLMATHHLIISVVADAKPLPVSKIEAIRARALKDMKEHMPMSYAKSVWKM